MKADLINSSVVPAAPGYFVIYTAKGDDRTTVEPTNLDPVIAWRVDTAWREKAADWDDIHSFVRPITSEGSVSDGQECGIVRPDGIVDDYDGSYACAADWLASKREWHEKEAARIAAKPARP